MNNPAILPVLGFVCQETIYVCIPLPPSHSLPPTSSPSFASSCREPTPQLVQHFSVFFTDAHPHRVNRRRIIGRYSEDMSFTGIIRDHKRQSVQRRKDLGRLPFPALLADSPHRCLFNATSLDPPRAIPSQTRSEMRRPTLWRSLLAPCSTTLQRYGFGGFGEAWLVSHRIVTANRDSRPTARAPTLNLSLSQRPRSASPSSGWIERPALCRRRRSTLLGVSAHSMACVAQAPSLYRRSSRAPFPSSAPPSHPPRQTHAWQASYRSLCESMKQLGDVAHWASVVEADMSFICRVLDNAVAQGGIAVAAPAPTAAPASSPAPPPPQAPSVAAAGAAAGAAAIAAPSASPSPAHVPAAAATAPAAGAAAPVRTAPT